MGGQELDKRVPALCFWLAHCFNGEELEVAVGLASAAVVAGIEESEEPLWCWACGGSVWCGLGVVLTPCAETLVCSF